MKLDPDEINKKRVETAENANREQRESNRMDSRTGNGRRSL